MLLDQLVDAQALLVEAQKTGLDKEPDVQRACRWRRTGRWHRRCLTKWCAPQVTDEAIKARYDEQFAKQSRRA